MIKDNLKQTEIFLVRITSLLNYLKSNTYTVQQLAVLVMSDIQTVERDILLLQDSGFPLVKRPETNCWELISDYSVPHLDFTTTEIFAILALFKQHGNRVEDPLFETIKSAMLKIASRLSPEILNDVNDQLHYLPQKTNIPTPYNEPMYFHYNGSEEELCQKFNEKQKNIFMCILDALNKKNTLSIVYHSPSDSDVLETKVCPYTIFFSRAWYLIGYSVLYREVRMFKLARILQVEELEEPFLFPPDFSLSGYFGNAWRLIRVKNSDQNVIIRFSQKVAQNVREIKWHRTQEDRQLPDGRVELHFCVSGLQEIVWWILGYGAEAEVIEPPQLRQMIQQHVDQMLSFYEPSH